eukprot:scaffold55444_cov70-Phaeocystis_antarctica.AAC.2
MAADSRLRRMRFRCFSSIEPTSSSSSGARRFSWLSDVSYPQPCVLIACAKSAMLDLGLGVGSAGR